MKNFLSPLIWVKKKHVCLSEIRLFGENIVFKIVGPKKVTGYGS